MVLSEETKKIQVYAIGELFYRVVSVITLIRVRQKKPVENRGNPPAPADEVKYTEPPMEADTSASLSNFPYARQESDT